MRTGASLFANSCLVSVVAGGMHIARTQAAGNDPASEYVIIFGRPGAPIDLKDRTAFIATLKSASGRRDLVFRPAENGLSPNATGQAQADATVHIRAITQDQSATGDAAGRFRRDQKPLMDALMSQGKE